MPEPERSRCSAGWESSPGVDSDEAGEGWLRFCYAVPEDVIDQAIEWLAVAFPRFAEVVS